MIPSPSLISRRRQAAIDQIDAGDAAGFLVLYPVALADDGELPASSPVLRLRLARPCGVVDSTGIAFSVTDYGQVSLSGNVVAARLEDSNGVWCGNLTAGMATDDPVPELTLPQRMFRAGAFVRLVGAHLACS